MEFRLRYEGPLKSNAGVGDKHKIRKVLHSQIRNLWDHPPLVEFKGNLKPSDNTKHFTKNVGDFEFLFIVSSEIGLVAELDIILMRPEVPGKIISSGDIDNRVKTLFDALRCPNSIEEIPPNMKPTKDETPFYCLLEDDSLITSVKVTCDRLLEPKNQNEVLLLIHIILKKVKGTWFSQFIA